jgi:hypothetical protein
MEHLGRHSRWFLVQRQSRDLIIPFRALWLCVYFIGLSNRVRLRATAARRDNLPATKTAWRTDARDFNPSDRSPR